MPTFLEAVNDFINNNTPPHEIIFQEIISHITRLKRKISLKTGINIDIRFDELQSIVFDDLIFKKGIKILLRSPNDEQAISSLNYLILQKFNNQFLDANPELKKLNDDLKYLLTDHLSCFNIKGKSQFLSHKKIALADDFDKKLFVDFKFASYSERNSRLSKIFSELINILSQEKELPYPELIKILQMNLGIAENQFVYYEDQDKNIDQKEEAPKNDSQASKNDDLMGDSYQTNNDESEPDSFKGNSDHLDASFLSSDSEFESKLEKIKNNDSLNNTMNIDSNIDYMNIYLNTLTQRQIDLLGVEIVSKSSSQGNLPELIDIDSYKNSIYQFYGIKKSTYYDELKIVNQKFKLISKKFSLNDEEKLKLMKQLTNYYLDRFDEFLRNQENGN